MSDSPASRPVNTAPASTPTNPSAPLVAIYWLIVLIPLCWGVYQTVQKSIPLFHVTSTTVAANVPPADSASTPTGSPAPVAVPTATP